MSWTSNLSFYLSKKALPLEIFKPLTDASKNDVEMKWAQKKLVEIKENIK